MCCKMAASKAGLNTANLKQLDFSVELLDYWLLITKSIDYVITDYLRLLVTDYLITDYLRLLIT